jgi:hypothetical protein
VQVDAAVIGVLTVVEIDHAASSRESGLEISNTYRVGFGEGAMININAFQRTHRRATLFRFIFNGSGRPWAAELGR